MNSPFAQIVKAAALLAFICLSIQPALAQTSQCSFTRMGGTLIDFGLISAANRNDIIGIDNVGLTCNAGLGLAVSYSVAISSGSSGTFANRTLRFAGSTLNYNLYTEPTFMQVFGDGSMGSNSATVNGLCANGVSCTVPVYGRINGGQSLRAGQFTDAVIVTVSF